MPSDLKKKYPPKNHLWLKCRLNILSNCWQFVFVTNWALNLEGWRISILKRCVDAIQIVNVIVQHPSRQLTLELRIRFVSTTGWGFGISQFCCHLVIVWQCFCLQNKLPFSFTSCTNCWLSGPKFTFWRFKSKKFVILKQVCVRPYHNDVTLKFKHKF